MNKIQVRAMVVTGAAVILLAGQALAKVVNKTIASVNNEVITMEDFNKKTAPMLEQYRRVYKGADIEDKIKEMKKELLQQMVEEKVLRQEAKNAKIVISKQDIQKGVDEVKKRFNPADDFKEYKDELAKQGYTEKGFENDIKEQLMVMKLIEKEVKDKVAPPTEDEVKKYYEDHKADMKQEEQVKASHILIRCDEKADLKTQSEALKKIQDVQAKLKKGEDFAALAKQYSEDPGSKDNGGDLGFFTKETMVPEFSKAAFALKPGQVSDIVKTPFGYHIIKVTETKPAKMLTLDDEVGVGGEKKVKVKDYLQNIVYQEKMEKKFEEWMKGLREKAKIVTNELE